MNRRQRKKRAKKLLSQTMTGFWHDTEHGQVHVTVRGGTTREQAIKESLRIIKLVRQGRFRQYMEFR